MFSISRASGQERVIRTAKHWWGYLDGSHGAARILGITDHYDPASSEVFDFSIPLSKLKLISFE